MKKYKFDNWDDAIEVLKDDGFLFVSFRHKSIPSEGSPIKLIKCLATNKDRKGNRGKIEIRKVINHKNSNITIQTNLGSIQFFK